jgi:drug/metabolite transporter (DMT)-like permease
MRCQHYVLLKLFPLLDILFLSSIKTTASFSPHHHTVSQTKAGIMVIRTRHYHGTDCFSGNRHSRKADGGEFSMVNARSPRSLAVGISGDGGDDGDDEAINDDDSDDAAAAALEDATRRGRALLCLVALLYGTLNVSLRLIYQLPDAPTAAALSTARGWLASVAFAPLLLLHRPSERGRREKGDGASSTDDVNVGTSIKSQQSPFLPFLIAGLELAFWNFLAQGLLNIGLLTTSSARASFLTQTSVIITPALSRLFGQRVPPKVWVACGLALVGLSVLSAGGGAAAPAAPGVPSVRSLVRFSTGDWLVLGAALSWSLYLLRLAKLGPMFDEINLQFVKTTLLAVFYTFWLVGGTVLGGGDGLPKAAAATTMGASFGWLMNGVAGLILLYSAVGPGTIADVLQQRGQKQVTASEANVILSMEPIFSALCAWFVLGEVTSMKEAVGGGIILAAALVAAR